VAALGREVFIVACCDQYPFSLAAALMGINEIMLKVVDDPPFVKALMWRCAEYQMAYGAALATAGADLLSGGDSPVILVGPELYQRLALPFEQHVITELKKRTGKPVSLHVCGKAGPWLPAMAVSGAEVLEIDHFVDLSEACRLVGPELTLWGNLDPVGVLAQGSVAEVQHAAQEALAAVRAAGHRRFVLSSGCTLALETPYANLEALLRI
jgi:uroporphyrinogen-III decarboxylase